MRGLILFPLAVITGISLWSLFMGESMSQLTWSTNIAGIDVSADMSFYDSMINTVIGIAIICGVVGVSVLGSGLSDKGIHAIQVGIVYAAMWGCLSAISWNQFVLVPFFGQLIWYTLTLFYAAGALMEIIGAGQN